MKKLISISTLCIALGLAVGVYEYWFVSDDYYLVHSHINVHLAAMNMYSGAKIFSFEGIERTDGLLTFSIDKVSSMRPSLNHIVFHFRLLSALKSCRTGINQLRDFQTAQRVEETITSCVDGLVMVKAG